MNKKNPYHHFNRYLLRTPIFAFSFFEKLTSQWNISEGEFQKLCSTPLIREALFLASPLLLRRIDKWLDGDLKDEKKIEKIKLSVFKYLTRASTRPTPFGLFAGCSIGAISNCTDIKVKQSEINKKTRLDMTYLVRLSNDLSANTIIRNQLKFYSNSSIFRVSNKYRYIEYVYLNGVREYRISVVSHSEYLENILLKSVNGVLINDLIKYLTNEGFLIEDSTRYIEDLIENQILKSEMEPSITEGDYLSQILLQLKNIIGVDDLKLNIIKLKDTVSQLTTEKKINISSYLRIEENLKKIGTEYNLNYLFQSDLVYSNQKNVLDEKVVNKIRKSIQLLNLLTNYSKNKRLNNFQKLFYKRFEDSEVELTRALDVELGIAYGQNDNFENINPLLDGVAFYDSDVNRKYDWSPINSIFQNKLMEAYKNNKYVIYLKDEDFIDFSPKWNDLTDTLSCIIGLLEVDGTPKIKLRMASSSSSANLLARFGFYNDDLLSYLKEITEVESKINSDKILAEVLHLPDDRVGNVLIHPALYDYEIPILTKSNKTNDKQIPLSDLMLSARYNKRLVLRSKKLGKEIVPRITNAHNFHNDSLPIYQFLADMQTQKKRRSIGFYLGDILSSIKFIPRIEYEDVILQTATWNFETSDVQEIINNQKNEPELKIEISELRKVHNIPKYISLIDGENELLINLDNYNSIKVFLNFIKNKKHFTFSEFLFDESSPIKNERGHLVNEIVLGFYNNEKLNKSV